MFDHDINNDDFFRLISESKLKMPFSDFEETVMHRIENGVKRKGRLSLNGMLSMVFSFVAYLLGVLLIGSLQHMNFHFPDVSTGTTILLLQITLVFLFLLHLEKYIRSFITPKH